MKHVGLTIPKTEDGRFEARMIQIDVLLLHTLPYLFSLPLRTPQKLLTTIIKSWRHNLFCHCMMTVPRIVNFSWLSLPPDCQFLFPDHSKTKTHISFHTDGWIGSRNLLTSVCVPTVNTTPETATSDPETARQLWRLIGSLPFEAIPAGLLLFVSSKLSLKTSLSKRAQWVTRDKLATSFACQITPCEKTIL